MKEAKIITLVLAFFLQKTLSYPHKKYHLV